MAQLPEFVGLLLLGEDETFRGSTFPISETDELIALTKSGQVFRQADEATVFLKEISPDRFNFIIEGERGVITAHRNWPLKEIQGIAERYGWEWTP